MERPTYIDLGDSSSRAPSSASARLGQLSPRILHSHGDIPPALSPLDAFAAESRRLAKELEATRLAGEKRMSRLPPALVTHSLNQHQANRPACFRSLSNATPEPVPQIPSHLDQQKAALNPTVTEPYERPQSSYPHLGGARANTEGEEEEVFSTPRESVFSPQSTSYFEITHDEPTHEITESPVKITGNELSSRSINKRESDKSGTNLLEGLAPPNAAFARSKLYPESSDDDYQSSNAGSTFSRPRKLSASSGTSFPASPAIPNHDRKGSNDSDTSLASLKPQRQTTMNFSRPLSSMSFHLRSDTPLQPHPEKTLERKPSHFSEMSREGASFEDDRSVASDGFVTYTHKKFTLPRGRAIEKASNRISTMFLGLSTSDFQMEPLFSGPTSAREGGDEYVDGDSVSSERGSNELAPRKPESLTSDSRPKSRPVSNAQVEKVQTSQKETQNLQHSNEEEDHVTPLPDARLSSATSGSFPKRRSSLMINTFSFRDDDDSNYKVSTLSPIPGSTADAQSEQSYSTSNKSESTVRPSTARTTTNYQELSADDHVDKAIKLHEHGDLKESTYHLRIAVKQNHPTAMLLYALACRHGWGMRANPKEGVAWLRKAVDTAMLEVAADEDVESDKPKPDVNAKKSHQAQFALTVYELGVSHLNGWGVEQDKALALRCFEIAGNWGDTDALTEAGFCYAQGVGCKKDLKKAAKFYRRAAEKGVSMVGNSWIYKDKYLDQDDVNNDDNKRKSRSKGKDGDQNRKARDKSKTRSIWSWKKSVPTNTGEV